MGLIKCSQCGKMISDRLSNCIQCGDTLAKRKEEKNQYTCVICDQPLGELEEIIQSIHDKRESDEILCKNCGLMYKEAFYFQIQYESSYIITEQYDELYNLLIELTDNDFSFDEQFYSICDQAICVLARMVDREYYERTRISGADKADEKNKKMVNVNFEAFDVFDKFLDDKGYDIEESDGGEMYYAKKHSLRFFLKEQLIELVKYHNWAISRRNRDMYEIIIHGRRIKVTEQEKMQMKDNLTQKLATIVNETNRIICLFDDNENELIQKHREKILQNKGKEM